MSAHHIDGLAADFSRGMPALQRQLYLAGQRATPTCGAVDALLDAHRAKHGEPEQAAYAARPDPRDLGLPQPPALTQFQRLVELFGLDGAHLLRDYLQEHHRWKAAS